jgi:hypothetical protein
MKKNSLKTLIKRNGIFILTLVLPIILCFSLLKEGHNWGDDFCLYINQAKSINNGSISLLKSNNEFSIINSSFHTFSPIVAPWGFPILLSPVFKVFGMNILAFKVLIIVFFGLFLHLSFLLMRKGLGNMISMLTIIFMATNYGYIFHTNSVLTEFPFLAFSLGSLLLIKKYKSGNFKIVKVIILSLTIFFAFMIRSEGILLAVCLAATLIRQYFIRNDFSLTKKLIWIISPFILLIIYYGIYSLLFPSGFGSHVDDRSLITMASVIDNFKFYQAQLGIFLNPDMPEFATIAIEFIFILGLIHRFKEDFEISIYLLLLLVTFLFWPFHEPRYLFIFSPFLLYFIIQGIKEFLTFSFKKNFQIVHLALFAVITLNVYKIYNVAVSKSNNLIEGPETKEAQQMFSFVKNETPHESTVVFFRARAMTLYGERKAAMIFWNDWEQLVEKGDYIVLHKEMGAYCQMPVEDPFFRSMSFKKQYDTVFDNSKFIVYAKRK